MITTATFPGPYGEKLKINLSSVYQNGQMKICLLDTADGMPYGTLSVNGPANTELAPGEFLAKVWSENEELAAAALKSGLFEDTGKRVMVGHAEAQVWSIKET